MIDLNNSLFRVIEKSPNDQGVLEGLKNSLEYNVNSFPIGQVNRLIELSHVINKIKPTSLEVSNTSSTIIGISKIIDTILFSFQPNEIEIPQLIKDCGVDFYVNFLWKKFISNPSELVNQLEFLIKSNKENRLTDHQYRSVISSLLSFTNKDNNRVTHSKEIVNILFDYSFDKIEIDDLLKMLFSQNNAGEMPITIIEKDKRLLRLGRLCQIYFQHKVNFNKKDEELQKFLRVNPDLTNYVKPECEDARNLKSLFLSAKNSEEIESLAHYMYLLRVSVFDILSEGGVSMASIPDTPLIFDQTTMSRIETKFMILAQFLRYYSFPKIPTINESTEDPMRWAHKMLKEAKIPFTVDIKNFNLFQDSKIKELPYCCQLFVANAGNVTLPDFPNAHTVYFDFNNHVTILDTTFPTCKKFTMYMVKEIIVIPSMPLCKEFICMACEKLNKIPQLPKCEIFKVRGNKSLPIDLSYLQLPLCKTFECSRQDMIVKLPDLPSQINVSITDCPEISDFKVYPTLQKFEVTDSTKLQPTAQHVRRTKIGCEVINKLTNVRNKFNVKVDDIEQNPVKVLSDLADVWLEDSIFPEISYFIDLFDSQIEDDGGVARDFVSKILKKCFVEYKTEGFITNSNGLPELTDENQRRAFKVIGKIMAHCVGEDSTMRTGPLFDEKFYEYMMNSSLSDDIWNVSTYLEILKASDHVKQLIISNAVQTVSLGIRDTDFLKVLNEYVREGESDLIKFNSNPDTVILQEGLFAAVLQAAKKNPSIMAIHQIAEGFNAVYSSTNLEGLKSLGPVYIKSRIEGSITKDMFLYNLKWTNSGDIPEEDFTRVKGFMERWVKEHKLPQLYKLLQMITGSAGRLLKPIEIFVTQTPHWPYASTCDISLKLYAYKEYESFAGALETCLEYVDVGTGFADQDMR